MKNGVEMIKQFDLLCTSSLELQKRLYRYRFDEIRDKLDDEIYIPPIEQKKGNTRYDEYINDSYGHKKKQFTHNNHPPRHKTNNTVKKPTLQKNEAKFETITLDIDNDQRPECNDDDFL